mgnify:CR=1 FL=1
MRDLSYLSAWGWNERLTDSLSSVSDGSHIGRVVEQVHHTYHVVIDADGATVAATVAGSFEYRIAELSDYPAVGDWVVLEPDAPRIMSVMPRGSVVSRAASGTRTQEQVIVANVSVLFLVFGLDGGRNFSEGLLLRSLLTARNAPARPVVVLNKCDIANASHIDAVRAAVSDAAPGTRVHVVSAVSGAGITGLLGELEPGETVALLGKSGVGKSALLNVFSGHGADGGPARIGAQRQGDLQGRHTTTYKSLYRLPSGVIVADLPGLRELQLWGETDSLDEAFPDIAVLARDCRFSDCRHDGEPGCRVAEALGTGELSADRFERYLEYQRELLYLERRRDQRAQAEEKKRWKVISKELKRMKRDKP